LVEHKRKIENTFMFFLEFMMQNLKQTTLPE